MTEGKIKHFLRNPGCNTQGFWESNLCVLMWYNWCLKSQSKCLNKFHGHCQKCSRYSNGTWKINIYYNFNWKFKKICHKIQMLCNILHVQSMPSRMLLIQFVKWMMHCLCNYRDVAKSFLSPSFHSPKWQQQVAGADRSFLGLYGEEYVSRSNLLIGYADHLPAVSQCLSAGKSKLSGLERVMQ